MAIAYSALWYINYSVWKWTHRNTKPLSKNVVGEINEHFETYKQAIKSQFISDNKQSSDEAIKDFISSELSQEGFWGGSETILAVSNMYRANIVVFLEGNEVYFATGFNPEYERIE